MMAIVDGRPVLMTLPRMLDVHVSHRERVIERRTEHELEKARARAHILDGLVLAQQRIDDVIAAGRASASREHFEEVLRKSHHCIALFRSLDAGEVRRRASLPKLSQLDVSKIEAEHAEVQATIADLEDVLARRERRLNILLTELDEVVERHGDDRRTDIDPAPLSMDREDLIEEQAIVITLSEDDYIRHLPVESFKLQNRGGKGLKGVATKDEDTPQMVVTCFSKDRLLIFTNTGRVYGLKAWETPRGSRHARGTHIRNLLERMQDDESIIAILPISKERTDDPGEDELIFATREGHAKRSQLKEWCLHQLNARHRHGYRPYRFSRRRIQRNSASAKVFAAFNSTATITWWASWLAKTLKRASSRSHATAWPSEAALVPVRWTNWSTKRQASPLALMDNLWSSVTATGWPGEGRRAFARCPSTRGMPSWRCVRSPTLTTNCSC